MDIPVIRENITGKPMKLQNIWATSGAVRCPADSKYRTVIKAQNISSKE